MELSQNNAFNFAAAYLTKTKGMKKSVKSFKIIFMHRMALLNYLVQHSKVGEIIAISIGGIKN